MVPDEDVRWIRALLDAHYDRLPGVGVASEGPGDHGVPVDMRVGPVDEEGWVSWGILEPRLTSSDLASLESRFGVTLPDALRAYLLAACHLFDQVHSSEHDQTIMMPDVPSDRPLGPLESILEAWRCLIPASYVPFAEWGDGWGPMCFDVAQRSLGDCPVVWMDHEQLIPLGEEACGDRASVMPYMRPLYSSTRALLEDVFGT